MEFLKANIGNIVAGTVAFAVLAVVAIRLISNFRKGKTGCSCGCEACESRREET